MINIQSIIFPLTLAFNLHHIKKLMYNSPYTKLIQGT